MDPYRIEGPALISFSGGRTSGLMLYNILKAWDGALPMDVHTIFCNTGKEHHRTLDFVRDCSERWGVLVHWLEFKDAEKPGDRWSVTDYEHAARNGEPYEAVNLRKGYLPNPVTRTCTTEMKIHLSHRFARAALGFKDSYVKAIGLRRDEAHRVARARQREENGGDPWDCAFPLYDAGATKDDVIAFWRNSEFDLQLPLLDNGTTPMGNCDLCFLKGAGKIASIIREEPDRALWWARQERLFPSNQHETERFRVDRPSYQQMLDQRTLNLDGEDTLDCACTD